MHSSIGATKSIVRYSDAFPHYTQGSVVCINLKDGHTYSWMSGGGSVL